MRRALTGWLWAMGVLACGASDVRSDVSAGIRIDDDGIKGFYLAIGEHYRVPEREVVRVRDKKIPDDELPVVFFIAARARVAPGVIVDLRLGGRSWYEISARYGFSPEIYYVPLAADPGPPYGKAYGHYKKKPRKQWGEIRLSDADIVNLVNLRFISTHYGRPADEVVVMRGKGESFITIQAQAKQKKEGKEKRAEAGKAAPAKGKKK